MQDQKANEMPSPSVEPVYLKIIISSEAYKKMDDFRLRWKGFEVTDVSIRVQLPDGNSKEADMSMSEFLEAVGLADADEILKPCETCAGNGEVNMFVDDGEGHSAPVDKQPCPDCQVKPDDEPERED